MKTIKFRAYHLDDGMVYFDFDSFIKDYHDQYGNIMQFTGLQDKNGVDIYEGDNIRVCDNKNGLLTVVFVNEYVGGWVLIHESTKNKLSLGARKSNTIEVIGNIHEQL
jgi:uncharacterized phage protein (TIGR01671 family)